MHENRLNESNRAIQSRRSAQVDDAGPSRQLCQGATKLFQTIDVFRLAFPDHRYAITRFTQCGLHARIAADICVEFL
jgi:hypothetical protein